MVILMLNYPNIMPGIKESKNGQNDKNACVLIGLLLHILTYEWDTILSIVRSAKYFEELRTAHKRYALSSWHLVLY